MNFWKQADRHYGANETIWPVRITASFTADVYATDWEDAVDAARQLQARRKQFLQQLGPMPERTTQ